MRLTQNQDKDGNGEVAEAVLGVAYEYVASGVTVTDATKYFEMNGSRYEDHDGVSH